MLSDFQPMTSMQSTLSDFQPTLSILNEFQPRLSEFTLGEILPPGHPCGK